MQGIWVGSRVDARAVLRRCREYGLDLELMRGQCYDGAGNMGGSRVDARAVVRRCTRCGLDLELMRGQCYDGALDIVGTNAGAATLITKHHKLVLCLHCTSHCLNLAVGNGLDNIDVRNMMDVVRRVDTFFDSHPNRQLAMEMNIDSIEPEANMKKLADLCRTRWVQRLDVLQTFQKTHRHQL